MEELRHRKRALSASVAASSASIRAAKQSAAEKAKRELRQWSLEHYPSLLYTTVAVYLLADYSPEPVVVFMRGQERKRGWRERSDQELFRIAEDTFLSVDMDVLTHLVDESNPKDVAVYRTAAACVAQWRAAVWGKAFRTDTEAIAAEFERVRASFPEEFRPSAWLGTAGARKQGTRLRRRWGGRFGAVRPREEVPVDVMQAKAFWIHHCIS